MKDNMNKPCSLFTRRQFLLGLGASVVTAACAGKTITVFEQSTTASTSLPMGSTSSTSLASTGSAAPAGTFTSFEDRTLVVVEFGGGNDSLSMVVPHANARYHDLRPTLVIDDPLDLDGEIGLHPALTDLAAQYSAGGVAIVEGVGTKNPDLSHFLSMRRWWDGTDKPDHTGWLGRWLDGAVGYDQLLAGITIGPGPSQAMLGSGSFVVNIADASGLGGGVPWWIDDQDELMAAWAGFAPVNVPLAELSPIQRAITQTVDAQKRVNDNLQPLRDAIDAGTYPEDDSWSMVGQFRLAGHLVASGLAPRVIFIHGFGDFDTHENQIETHGRMMREFNGGLVAFNDIVTAAGVQDKALIMTTSEFGRRVADNDGGTDHGTAATHLLIGPSVAGGRYGEAPSLEKLDAEGNLQASVDFRSMYATVLDGWLGTEHAQVLRAEYETLPVFA